MSVQDTKAAAKPDTNIVSLADVEAAVRSFSAAGLSAFALVEQARARSARRLRARVVGTYGKDSPEAKEAERVVALREREAKLVDAEVQRAAIEIPTADAKTFVYFGRVTDSDGIGVEGAKVRLGTANAPSLAHAVSDRRGIFELRLQEAAIHEHGASELRLEVTSRDNRTTRATQPIEAVLGECRYGEVVVDSRKG
jgi:hypothetical protein